MTLVILLPVVLGVIVAYRFYMNKNINTHAAMNALEEANAHRKRLTDKINRKIKIIYTFTQLVSSMQFNMGITFPPAFAAMTSGMSVSGLNPFDFVPFACVATTNYYDKLLATCLAPICISLVLLLAHLGFRHKTAKFFSWFLVLTYLVLLSCSSVVMGTLNCDYFEDTGKYYMVSDVSSPIFK